MNFEQSAFMDGPAVEDQNYSDQLETAAGQEPDHATLVQETLDSLGGTDNQAASEHWPSLPDGTKIDPAVLQKAIGACKMLSKVAAESPERAERLALSSIHGSRLMLAKEQTPRPTPVKDKAAEKPTPKLDKATKPNLEKTIPSLPKKLEKPSLQPLITPPSPDTLALSQQQRRAMLQREIEITADSDEKTAILPPKKISKTSVKPTTGVTVTSPSRVNAGISKTFTDAESPVFVERSVTKNATFKSRSEVVGEPNVTTDSGMAEIVYTEPTGLRQTETEFADVQELTWENAGEIIDTSALVGDQSVNLESTVNQTLNGIDLDELYHPEPELGMVMSNLDEVQPEVVDRVINLAPDHALFSELYQESLPPEIGNLAVTIEKLSDAIISIVEHNDSPLEVSETSLTADPFGLPPEIIQELCIVIEAMGHEEPRNILEEYLADHSLRELAENLQLLSQYRDHAFRMELVPNKTQNALQATSDTRHRFAALLLTLLCRPALEAV